MSLKDNYGRPRSDYFERIKSLDDDGLSRECEQRIWLSAYANNNPKSDYHWQVDGCFDECARRGKPDIYADAYKAVSER